MTSGAGLQNADALDRAYALWAGTYDKVPNPLLTLEERYLEPMLPSVYDKTVLDLGCGTGRLLGLPSLSKAERYVGVDLSSAMLAQATNKVRSPRHLLRADCRKLPLRARTADVVICSFLLGYVNVGDLAEEIARVSKSSTDVYLSEFHPDAGLRGWKRGFRCGDQVVELPTNGCAPEHVEHVFQPYGFDLVSKVEPGFGKPEREILEAAGKSAVFESSTGMRVIFICHLKRSGRAV